MSLPQTLSPIQIRAAAERERRERKRAGKKSDYQKFKERYWSDPAGFARDCIAWRPKEEGLSEYQEKALTELAAKKRFTVRGPHGLGKTALAAIAVLWFSLTRDGEDWKCPTLASAWRQLTKFLWPEIHKWARRLKWGEIGRRPFTQRELLTLTLKLNTGSAFAIASDDEAAIEGAHAEHLFYVFDESKTIPGDTWDAAEGAMSTGECYWLAISTPGETEGRFYDIHKRSPGFEDWTVFHVTLDMAIKAGRIDAAWAEQRLRQWGYESAVFQNRVLGNFAASDEDGVIPLAWIERANERWYALNESGEWGELHGIGVDVGRGGDPSVIARRHGWAIKSLERFHEKSIMPLAGRIVAILRTNNIAVAVVDVIGLGAGVVDRSREPLDDGLPEVGDRVYAFVANAKTDKLDKLGEFGFSYLRYAGYWEVREILSDESIPVALPPDDKLTGDLTAPHYTVRSGGKIKVESKEEIRKRIGRSTDDGDAVIQVFMDKYADRGEDLSDLGRVDNYKPLAA